MSSQLNHNRRNFLKIAAATGGGLLLGFNWTDSEAAVAGAPLKGVAAPAIDFNSYLSINPQGVITILSPNPEVGQGIKTAFPIIVAEELDADWKNVVVEQAPLDTQNSNGRSPGAVAPFHTPGNGCAWPVLRPGTCCWRLPPNAGTCRRRTARPAKDSCSMPPANAN